MGKTSHKIGKWGQNFNEDKSFISIERGEIEEETSKPKEEIPDQTLPEKLEMKELDPEDPKIKKAIEDLNKKNEAEKRIKEINNLRPKGPFIKPGFANWLG